MKGQTGLVRIETAKPGTTASVMRLLLDQGVTTIAATRPSLEEVYLRVFGERP